jgi:hypothetical protein
MLSLISSLFFSSLLFSHSWIKPGGSSYDGQCCHAKSQGNLLSDVDYFQRRWSHVCTAMGDRIKNLINYITRMNVEYKVNMRLDMLTQDGSPCHIHMFNYCTKYRDKIFQYAIIQSDAKPSSIEKMTI